MSFLALEGEEVNFIWKTICDLQLIFHPRYSKEGIINYKEIRDLKHRYNKKINIVLDRNLFSSLIKLSRKGCLKDEREMRIIALLMTWLNMNDFPASAGLALKEYATKISNAIKPRRELREFNNIFEFYPSMFWWWLAKGSIKEIPVCSLPVEPYNTDVNYLEEDDHLLMHIATMLHTVYLFRQKELSAVEKMIDFIKWNYNHLLISESTIVYVAMLFTNQMGIKAPKNAGSNDIEKIYYGCRNQAWDLKLFIKLELFSLLRRYYG